MTRNAWRLLAIAAAQLLCDRAIAEGRVPDPGLGWREGVAEFSFTEDPGPADLGGRAHLVVNDEPVPLDVEGTIQAGADPDLTSLWRKSDLRLGVALADLDPFGLKLSASDQAVTRYIAPGLNSGRQEQSGRVATGLEATVTPWSSVSLTAGATVAQETKVADSGAPLHLKIRGKTQSADAKVSGTWKPVRFISVQVGAEETHVGVIDAQRAQRSYFSPSARLSLAPWQGAAIAMGFERRVAPYDASVLSPLVGAAVSNRDLEPDHAWHAEASLSLALGGARLEARLGEDLAGSVTELAGTSTATVNTSAPLRSRQVAEISASLPLDSGGLRKTTLTARANWQRSSVSDPVTRQLRQVSGERPHAAQLEVARFLSPFLEVGVKGETCGTAAIFAPGFVSTTSQSANVGAFLHFKPGPFEIDLDAQTTVGTETATQYRYRDTRADSQIAQTVARNVGGPSLLLALKKTF